MVALNNNPDRGHIINDVKINSPYTFGMFQYTTVKIDNISWLISKGQWNERALYPDCFNWVVQQASRAQEGFRFVTDSFTDYDWVANISDLTFRLPLIPPNQTVSNKRLLVETENEGMDWYNVYSDGWTEQGGHCENTGTQTKTASLHKPYLSPNYTMTYSLNSWGANHAVISNKKAESFDYRCSLANGFDWEAKGYGPVPSIDNSSVSMVDSNYLYYYVGDGLQNVELLDIARLIELVQPVVIEYWGE